MLDLFPKLGYHRSAASRSHISENVIGRTGHGGPKSSIHSMTLVWLAASFLLGIFLGWQISGPAIFVFAASGVLVVGLAPAWYRPRVRISLLLLTRSSWA